METQVIKCRIVRRTSQYNKYIKWYAECLREDGSVYASIGYRTEREARASFRDHIGAVGNRIVNYVHKEVNP